VNVHVQTAIIEPATPSSTSAPRPDTVMKVKATGGGGVAAISEAEALRKDPLKNYGMSATGE
jgi:hypothetical protein